MRTDAEVTAAAAMVLTSAYDEQGVGAYFREHKRAAQALCDADLLADPGPGRTPQEVTAAAERTADLALRCVRLTADRDRARDIAVALEGQVARVAALCEALRLDLLRQSITDTRDTYSDGYASGLADALERLRAAVPTRCAPRKGYGPHVCVENEPDPDPADCGTGRDGGGS